MDGRLECKLFLSAVKCSLTLDNGHKIVDLLQFQSTMPCESCDLINLRNIIHVCSNMANYSQYVLLIQ
jgi:hypothetical protein